MRRISKGAHRIFDYFAGIALLMVPTLVGVPDLPEPAVLVPRILGLLMLGQSLLTDYEGGVLRVLPLRVHFVIDYLSGILLIVSPWLFRFHSQPRGIWVPDIVCGAGILLVTLVTQSEARRHAAGN